jgi:lipid II:glycine glycyltransferase (peptidoglycan interpeptide bridge formation enzyme)
MLELKRRQIRWLDLGGVNTEALPGISRFKFGTGGALTILKGTYLST